MHRLNSREFLREKAAPMETFNFQFSGIQGPINPMRLSHAPARSHSNPAIVIGTFAEVFFVFHFLCEVISTVSFVARETSPGTARDYCFENYLQYRGLIIHLVKSSAFNPTPTLSRGLHLGLGSLAFSPTSIIPPDAITVPVGSAFFHSLLGCPTFSRSGAAEVAEDGSDEAFSI
jgi:hypothetical protein